jgi:transcriptional regulator with XRE-family HTH domain
VFYVEYLRRERKLTQRQVAERTGINRTTVSNIECGRVNPTPEELERLALALSFSPPERLMRVIEVPDAAAPEPVETETV